MSVSSALYGGLLAYRMLHWQADSVSDIFKISLTVCLATACLSYLFWSLIAYKKESGLRGIIAGGLAAIFVLPVPAFASTLKREIGLLLEAKTGISLADITSMISLSTQAFISQCSLAEILAIPLSAIVGLLVATQRK